MKHPKISKKLKTIQNPVSCVTYRDSVSHETYQADVSRETF